MSELVTLPLGQTAEPHKCGSCVYFNRDDFGRQGGCSIVLPPAFAWLLDNAELKKGYENNCENGISRTSQEKSCGLYKSTGLTYITQTQVKAP